MKNIKEAILEATKLFSQKNITSANLDAEVLLLSALNKNYKDKSWLYLNYEKKISINEIKRFKRYIKRRLKLEPVAYIIKKKEFYGINFLVNKNTLIPRTETEIVVEKTLDFLKKEKGKFTILDIGTGSGCIIVSILKQKNISKKIEKAFACDISKKAIDVARKNAASILSERKISFINQDLEKAILKIRKEKNVIITANLPYISYEDYIKLEKNVKDFEPKKALLASEKGTFHIRRLIELISELEFSKYLILLEIDPKQTKSLLKIIESNLKESKTEVIKDLSQKNRIIKIYKD